MARPASERMARELTITHADLQRLLPPSSAANRNAIILLETVKMLARGRRVVHVYNATLVDKLGWSERTIKRAKRAARDAGLVMHDEVDGRGSKATAFVLDRSWVPALGRPTESPRGDSVGTLSKESKPLRVLVTASPCHQDPEGPPSRGSPPKPEGVVEPTTDNEHELRDALATAAPVDAVPEARDVLDELRRRVGGRPIDVPQLEAMRRMLIDEGASHSAATIAAALLRVELELDDGEAA